MRSERLDADFRQKLMQLLPPIPSIGGASCLRELINLPSASSQRTPDVFNGEMLELERPIVLLQLGQLVESIPLLVKLIWKLPLVLTEHFEATEPRGDDRMERREDWWRRRESMLDAVEGSTAGLPRSARPCTQGIKGDDRILEAFLACH